MESTSENVISLVELWQIFKRNWIANVGIALLAAIIIGVGYSLVFVPVYSSSSQYYVSNISDETPLYSVVQTSGAMEMANYCVGFLNGSVVLEDVLKTADLTPQEREVLTVPMLRSMIQAKVSTGSALIKVVVSSPDADFSYRIAQAIEKVLPLWCDRFNNQEDVDSNVNIKGSFMLKVTDQSTQAEVADNVGSLIWYPLITFFLVLIISYMIFAVIHFFDTTVYTRDHLKEKLPNMPIFGIIPTWEIANKNSSRAKKQRKTKKKNAEHVFAKERLILMENTPFYISEAFRQLSTNVTFCSLGDEGCAIGIVSARAATGKSFIMANLAVSLSQRIDKKVLLIDADMRCPMQHHIFNLKNTMGLSQLLSGQTANNDELYHILNNGSLTVLTSGDIPPNPLELLSSQKMTQLIEKWKKEYDYVLFDLPPVGEVADAIVLSNLISGFLFVLRSGVSDIRQVSEALAVLEERNAKIHGLVLTDVEKKNMPYHYAYRKSYRYSKKD